MNCFYNLRLLQIFHVILFKNNLIFAKFKHQVENNEFLFKKKLPRGAAT